MSHESEIANGLRYSEESKMCSEYIYREGEASPECKYIALENSAIKRGHYFSDYFNTKLSIHGFRVTAALVGKPADHVDSLTAAHHIKAHTRKSSHEMGYNSQILYKSTDYDNDLFLYLGNNPFPKKHTLEYETMPCKIENKSSLIYSIHKSDGCRFRMQALKPALHNVVVCTAVKQKEVKWFYTTSKNIYKFIEATGLRPRGAKEGQRSDFVLGENVMDEYNITYNEYGELIYSPRGRSLEFRHLCDYDDMVELDVNNMQSMGKFVKCCASTMKWCGATRWQKVLNRVADSMTNIKVMA